jgi:rubredoxin
MKTEQSRPLATRQKAAAGKKPRRLFKTVTCSYCGGEQAIGRDAARWACRDCKTAHDPEQPPET